MISTPVWPSSWKSRMRCNGIARPMWMSGDVTSIPSFTRSGRPSFSFASSPPSGSTSTAFRVRSAIRSVVATGATLAGVLRLLRRKPRPPKRRRIRRLRLLALLLVLFALGLSAFVFGLMRAINTQLGPLDPAAASKLPEANTYVYASDGHTVLAILRGPQARILVPWDEISPWVANAIVAIEDKRFYEHHGVDLRGVV